MKRPLIIGVVGLLLLAIAFGLNIRLNRADETAPLTSAAAPQPEAGHPAAAPNAAAPKPPAGAPTGSPAAVPAPAVADSAAADQKAKPPPSPEVMPPGPLTIRPTFDVVRVNPKGDAVIAGRAMPDAEVTVLDGERPIGSVVADGRGEWVLLPAEPLPAGNRELSLSAKLGNGPVMRSEQVVVLLVPDRESPGTAGAPAAQQAPPIALLVPRDAIDSTPAPSTLLQGPGVAPGGNSVLEPAPAPIALGDPPSATAEPAEARARVLEPAPLSVDIIDYTAGGQVVIAGAAHPGAAVQLYLNDRPIGRVASDARGAWRLEPTEAIQPGIYRLRADELAADGSVRSRIELPFARAGAEAEAVAGAAAAGPGHIVIQPGNNLWQIARRTYGQGVQFTVIYRANRERIRDPNLIYPGQVFRLPEASPSTPGTAPSGPAPANPLPG